MAICGGVGLLSLFIFLPQLRHTAYAIANTEHLSHGSFTGTVYVLALRKLIF